MAYTTIDDPSAHFQAKKYTGNGSSNHAITFDGNSNMQPDWLWNKVVSEADSHATFDSSRGNTKLLYPNLNLTEDNDGNGNIESFDSNGFTVGGNQQYANHDGATQMTWAWKANGGTTTSVSGTGTAAGSTKAGTYQANTTAGFSIITFSTGSDDNGDHRIQHGLGAVPHFILTKERDGTYEWYTYHHKGTDDNDYLRLNLTNATSNAGARNVFDGSDFTSTYFEMDNNNITNDNKTYVAYCFTEIQGYSKFGSYTGNANTDGPFVYTGFKPAFVLTKKTDNTSNWHLSDNKRGTFNPVSSALNPDQNYAENTTLDQVGIDFLSNGFKCRGSNDTQNGSNNYIYMCFAEHPFVSSKGTPTTAR